jgi:hypothetical protein
MPTDALVSPFPKELTTPPVTNMCLAMKRSTFLVNEIHLMPRELAPERFHYNPGDFF